MRLLALSDIHHNLVAVRKLRACEKNDFDAVIVAGDIGNESAAEFFRILETFECPVMYVYGNWDNKLDYESCFSPRCHLIHSNVITVGELSFTGFSGCPTAWGKNPLARGISRRIESQLQRGKLRYDRDQFVLRHESILRGSPARLSALDRPGGSQVQWNRVDSGRNRMDECFGLADTVANHKDSQTKCSRVNLANAFPDD